MTIALYGATGYTGRLVARELARRGLEVVLGGRDRGRLERAAQECSASAPVRTAALDDPSALRALLDGRRVLVNCAGPAAVSGEALVQAALDAGVHYIDAIGEQSFLRTVFDRYAAPAERRGIALLPGAGFDYAPGDCLARLVAGELDSVAELVVAYALDGSGVSGGSARGAAEPDHGGEVVYRDGSWRRPPRGVWRASFTFPAPMGRRPVTRYGSGEVLTVPRHTPVRNVVSVITTSSFAPHPALVGLFPYLRPAATLALRTPLRALLNRAMARDGSTAPSGQDRRSARFLISAIARGEHGAVARGAVRGTDFYGLTAAALAHGAEHLADPRFPGAGTLAPAAAYDPAGLLDGLAAHGVRWELRGPE
jgi:short subunit dehydrogenase-like uncharacterized protein